MLQVKPQTPPTHVALAPPRPARSPGQNVHEGPQRPTAESGKQPPVSPGHSWKPGLQAKRHATPSQLVTVALAGATQGEQAPYPQVARDVLETQSAPHRWVPARQVERKLHSVP